MAKWRIVETAVYEVEAPTAQEALDLYLQAEDRDQKYFVTVEDRTVEDEKGEAQEVTE